MDSIVTASSKDNKPASSTPLEHSSGDDSALVVSTNPLLTTASNPHSAMFTTFTKFGKLPQELRDEIWLISAREPLQIHVTMRYRDKKCQRQWMVLETSSPTKNLLLASKESKEILLKECQALRSPGRSSLIYANTTRDSVWFRTESFFDWHSHDISRWHIYEADGTSTWRFAKLPHIITTVGSLIKNLVQLKKQDFVNLNSANKTRLSEELFGGVFIYLQSHGVEEVSLLLGLVGDDLPDVAADSSHPFKTRPADTTRQMVHCYQLTHNMELPARSTVQQIEKAIYEKLKYLKQFSDYLKDVAIPKFHLMEVDCDPKELGIRAIRAKDTAKKDEAMKKAAKEKEEQAKVSDAKEAAKREEAKKAARKLEARREKAKKTRADAKRKRKEEGDKDPKKPRSLRSGRML